MERAREALMDVFGAGIAAVEPRHAVGSVCARDGAGLVFGNRGQERRYDFGLRDRVLIVGCGKAGAPMAAAVEEAAGEKCVGGAVTVKYGHSTGVGGLRTSMYEAAHPVPDEAGMQGAKRALEVLRSAGKHDLVVAVVSGGGSALWPFPRAGISLAQKLQATSVLLSCGADITEMNCVRKHLSAIKGGLAASAAKGARAVEVVVVSDVVGDPLDTIASGPFAADRSTFGQALQIIDKYGLAGVLPNAVVEMISRGADGCETETPKPGDPVFGRVFHTLCASNRVALEAAAEYARAHGFDPVVKTSELTGNVLVAAKTVSGWIRQQLAGARKRPVCILAGGETTVDLGRCHGEGGRNQELALLCSLELAGIERFAMISCGTDGTDGPTDAAGAFGDGSTVARALAQGLVAEKFVAEHDSYTFFGAIGDLVKTGPTQTNVMDMQVALVW